MPGNQARAKEEIVVCRVRGCVDREGNRSTRDAVKRDISDTLNFYSKRNGKLVAVRLLLFTDESSVSMNLK